VLTPHFKKTMQRYNIFLNYASFTAFFVIFLV